MFTCCLNCEKRFPACHDKCEDYRVDKEKMAQISRARNKNIGYLVSHYANNQGKLGRGRW